MGNTLDILKRMVNTVREDYSKTAMGTHASSTAFYFFTSLIPVVIIVACIAGQSGITEQDLVLLVRSVVPDVLGDFSETTVREAYDNAAIAISASLIALLWTASKGINALIRGLNSVYGVEENRNIIHRTAVSIASVIVMIALIVAAVYLIFSGMAISVLAPFLPGIDEPSDLTTIARAAVLFVLGLVVFALCYTFLPAGKRQFRDQLLGAAIAAIAWFALSLGFRIYVDHSTSFTLFYGSLAAVAIFLFWLYCIFLILLACGFFNRYHGKNTEDDSK